MTAEKQNGIQQHRQARLFFLAAMVCWVTYSIFGQSLLAAVIDEQSWLATHDPGIRFVCAMIVSFYMFLGTLPKKGIRYAAWTWGIAFVILYLFIKVDAAIPPFAGIGRVIVPVWFKGVLAVIYITFLAANEKGILRVDTDHPSQRISD